ncbi:unnamed protein product [Lasius platythorax]|uniref:Uncharacterized protein n=1 Tax=Lasius platythorax TaxID=488582 RepID=A0AAV2NDW2_9HYME
MPSRALRGGMLVHAAPIFSRGLLPRATRRQTSFDNRADRDSASSKSIDRLTGESFAKFYRFPRFSRRSPGALNGTENFHALNFQRSRRIRDFSSLLSRRYLGIFAQTPLARISRFMMGEK